VTPAQHDFGRDNLSLTLQVPNTWPSSLWTVPRFMITFTGVLISFGKFSAIVSQGQVQGT